VNGSWIPEATSNSVKSLMPHQNIKLFIRSRIIQCFTIEFFAKINYGLFSCIKTDPIPIPKALHLISKFFIKSGNYNNRVEINFSLNKLNSCSCSWPHLNPIKFLTISVKGVAKVLNLLTNLLQKPVKLWKLLTSMIDLGVGHSWMDITFFSSISIPLH